MKKSSLLNLMPEFYLILKIDVFLFKENKEYSDLSIDFLPVVAVVITVVVV